MQKETAFKNKILPKLKALPCAWVLKTQELSRSGTPDILMCFHGRFIAIELKTDEGVVSKLQKYNLDKIREARGISLVVTPKTMDDCLALLKIISKQGFSLFEKRRNKNDKN